MKTIAPRIYRALETRSGRGGLDIVVTAAAASFASLRAPTERRCLELGQLISAAWDGISHDTRRTIAAELGRARRVPRSLVDRFLDSPLDVLEPFLLASPCVTESDLAELAARGEIRIDRLVAARRAAFAGQPAQAAASPWKPAEAGRAEPVSPPLEDAAPGPLASMVRTAADARSFLRRAARPGGAARPAPGIVDTVAGIVAQARSEDPAGVYASLAHVLGLDGQRMREIEADAGGEGLVSALKVLGAGPADALTVAMLLKPAVGHDIRAFEALKAHYRDLDAEEARHRLGLPRQREAFHAAPRCSR